MAKITAIADTTTTTGITDRDHAPPVATANANATTEVVATEIATATMIVEALSAAAIAGSSSRAAARTTADAIGKIEMIGTTGTGGRGMMSRHRQLLLAAHGVHHGRSRSQA